MGTFTIVESLDNPIPMAISSHNDGSRKNNAIITLPGDDVDMETKFHVSIKNGKNSMKFEIVDSRGLAGAKLILEI